MKTSNMRFVLFKSVGGQWMWHLKSGNNRIVACSGESFDDLYNCKRSLNSLLKSVSGAAIQVQNEK